MAFFKTLNAEPELHSLFLLTFLMGGVMFLYGKRKKGCFMREKSGQN